jgi:hypothetical protein
VLRKNLLLAFVLLIVLLPLTGMHLGSNAFAQTPSDQWVRNPRNGHYYRLTDVLTWMEAEIEASEWGGHLVTLNSWEEESWIKTVFGANEWYWIGFNDIAKEGTWVWSSGEPVSYTNWAVGEPNNCGTWTVENVCLPEDGAVMNWIHHPGQEPSFGDYWNDLTAYDSFRGVVERTSRPAIGETDLILAGHAKAPAKLYVDYLDVRFAGMSFFKRDEYGKPGYVTDENGNLLYVFTIGVEGTAAPEKPTIPANPEQPVAHVRYVWRFFDSNGLFIALLHVDWDARRPSEGWHATYETVDSEGRTLTWTPIDTWGHDGPVLTVTVPASAILGKTSQWQAAASLFVGGSTGSSIHVPAFLEDDTERLPFPWKTPAWP